ncbi:MAG: hypothetical protein JXA11_15850, partial [Phycisphaerae bacterium]|nr:hypothetical protein [Phycisphaerae bacterium]
MKERRILVVLAAALLLPDLTVQATPLLQYHFSEGAELTDSGSLGLDLSTWAPSGGVTYVDGPTGYGQAVSLDPASNRVSTVYTEFATTDYDFSDGFTISLWFKAGDDQEATVAPLIFGKNSSFYLSIEDYDSDDEYEVKFKVYSTSADDNVYFDLNVLDDEWHYLEASYDPTTTTISLNVDNGTAATVTNSGLTDVRQFNDKRLVIGALDLAWNNQ